MRVITGFFLALVAISSLQVHASYAPDFKVEKSTRQLIAEKADEYNVSEKLMVDIIQCESSFKSNAENITKREESYGLVQINLMAHPNITEEQAKNKEFAVDFLAKNLSKGKGKMWSCYSKVKLG